MSLDPFVDDRKTKSSTEYEIYKGEICKSKEDFDKVDKKIEDTIVDIFKNRPEKTKELTKTLIPKIDSVIESNMFLGAQLNPTDSGISLTTAVYHIERISNNHQFGKYGPIFMIKYIEPIIDTRDGNVWAIQFRDLAYNQEIWDTIPNEWKIKDGNVYNIFIRDIMDDGFRNLLERLLVFKLLIKGELK